MDGMTINHIVSIDHGSYGDAERPEDYSCDVMTIRNYLLVGSLLFFYFPIYWEIWE